MSKKTCLFLKIRLLLFSEVNNKSNQIHITTIMLAHEFMGKNLHYFNSAYSSSKSEVTTTFIRINWIEFQLVLADHLPIRGFKNEDTSAGRALINSINQRHVLTSFFSPFTFLFHSLTDCVSWAPPDFGSAWNPVLEFYLYFRSWCQQMGM